MKRRRCALIIRVWQIKKNPCEADPGELEAIPVNDWRGSLQIAGHDRLHYFDSQAEMYSIIDSILQNTSPR